MQKLRLDVWRQTARDCVTAFIGAGIRITSVKETG